MHFVRVNSSPGSFPTVYIYTKTSCLTNLNPILFSTKAFIQMFSNKTGRISCGIPSDQRPYCSSSAAVIAANDDILLEILLRLPVRSLLVFKSVSKGWLSLISDPYFVNNHCLRTLPPPIPGLFLHKLSFLRNPEFDFIFLDGNVTGVPFKFLTFVNDPGGIAIQQSCNGLLCCSSFRANTSNTTYYIYNPSTKHYTTLPRSQNRETTGVISALFVCSISLAFEPLKSPHYKAICVLHHKEEDVYRIEIYSSETASWHLSGDAFPAFHDIVFNSAGVFWNGSVHWMSFRSDPLYFDVDRELLKTMPIPPRPDDDWENWVTMYFGEFKGHLHLIEGYGTESTRFDILEMEIDYSAWNVKYRVDLDTLVIACPEMVRDELDHSFEFSVLLVVDEEEKELSSLVLKIPDKVISYNLKEMTFKKIHDLSPGLHVQYKWSDAHRYIETLACV